jgi:hypothetical protein
MEHTINMEFNNELCNSVKNKNCKNLQCTHKKKNGELFCGIHLKSGNIELYKHILNDIQINGTNINDTSINGTNINDTNINGTNINDTSINGTNINSTINENIELYKPILNNIEINNNNQPIIIEDNLKESSLIDKSIIYTKEEFFNLFITNKHSNVSIFTLRNNIKLLGLNKFINTKQSKPLLINDIIKLIQKERYYDNNYDKIVFTQSIVRKWLVKRRYICCNTVEITSFDDIFDIPSKYYYLFNDSMSNKSFGYDIRSLLAILKSDYPSCPYTFRNYTDDEKNRIFNHAKKLSKCGIILEFDKLELNKDQEIEMRMKDVFHKINMLDNYSSHLWFKNLDIKGLATLYSKLEDIWNYRVGMDTVEKMRILQTNNGNAFLMSINTIKHIKSKIQLQEILLNEIDRFITEGINRDERKLGAMLMLTGLVEVSYEAASGLPHLVPF